MRRALLTPLVTAAIAAAAVIVLPAQRGGQLTDEARAERWRVENELASMAIIERNTGGRNYDEVNGIVAQSAVHHSAAYPSSVTITVVRK